MSPSHMAYKIEWECENINNKYSPRPAINTPIVLKKSYFHRPLIPIIPSWAKMPERKIAYNLKNISTASEIK